VAHEFQEAVVEVLAKKLAKAGIEYDAKTLAIVGGVSANRRLWEYTQEYCATKQELADVQLVKPTQMVYCTDNAAMIGVV
jgi:N6-L-threonylcarbamoyladenine synthase